MKSICVYCGSNFNGDPTLKKAIEDLAETMTSKRITLVFWRWKCRRNGRNC